MKNRVYLKVIIGLSIMLSFTQAGAVLLIDTAPITDPLSANDERCDGAISLKVTPQVDTIIDRLDAYIDPIGATNVRFMIADNPQNTVLYYGPPVAVGAGTQWVQSPAFSFTLLQGQTYEIAAMVEGCANFPWDQLPTTENGLATTSNNGNPTNYVAPTSLGASNGVDPRFRIYGTNSLVSGPPMSIPTLSAWGGVVLSISLLGLVFYSRRKRLI